jgi:oxalate---CoA ligase
MARYVPPCIDVPVTCFIADEGVHFETDPSRWRAWTPELRVRRIPGSHSAVITHRAALAESLEQAMTARDCKR